MTDIEKDGIRKLSKWDQRVHRMRTAPRIFDYCFFSSRTNRRVLLQVAEKMQDEHVVLDIGCGGKPFEQFFKSNCLYVGFDWKDSKSPDVTCDVSYGIPVKSKRADFVILSECLEHFPDPKAVLEEAYRVINDQGYIFVSTPFCFPIHGQPYDFYRFTEYFYRHIAGELGLRIDTLEASNTSPITPFLDFQNIFMPTPFIPFPLKQVLFTAFNLIVFLPDLFCRRMAMRNPESRIARYLFGAPVGYALIFRKITQSQENTRPEKNVRY